MVIFAYQCLVQSSLYVHYHGGLWTQSAQKEGTDHAPSLKVTDADTILSIVNCLC